MEKAEQHIQSEDIRNADMNELSEIRKPALKGEKNMWVWHTQNSLRDVI